MPYIMKLKSLKTNSRYSGFQLRVDTSVCAVSLWQHEMLTCKQHLCGWNSNVCRTVYMAGGYRQAVELCIFLVDTDRRLELCTFLVDTDRRLELCTFLEDTDRRLELCTFLVGMDRRLELCTFLEGADRRLELCTVLVDTGRLLHIPAVETIRTGFLWLRIRIRIRLNLLACSEIPCSIEFDSTER
jgi:hypothetical protein